MLGMKPPVEPSPVPWSTREVWLGLVGIALWGGAFVALRAGAAYLPFQLDPGLIISLGELLLLVPVWFLAMRKYRVNWAGLGLRPFPPPAVGLGCGLMTLSFLFNFIYGLILGLFGQRIQVDLVPVFAGLESPWLLLLGGAVIAPLVEEIFFRGFIFAGLAPRFGWQRAALISAFIFALVHLSLTALLPIFILGYIFALLYYLSGSLWPAIFMHILTNSLALGAAYLVANAEQFGLSLSLF